MSPIQEHRRTLIVALVVAATVSAAAVSGDTGEAASAAVAGEATNAPERTGRFPIDLDRMKADAAERFARVDTDGDEAISAEEFAAGAGEGGWSDRFLRGDRGPGRGLRRGDRAQQRRSGSRPFGDRGRGVRERMQASGEEVFDRADADEDGALSREEYDNLGDVRREVMRETMMARMFARLDTDDSGTLSGAELEPRVARLEKLDADGDGLVSRDEMPRRGAWR